MAAVARPMETTSIHTFFVQSHAPLVGILAGKNLAKKPLFRNNLAAKGGRKFLVFFGQISKANGPKSGI